ncbi:hypothetical protein LguiB_031511 [Lonicera macranthoides]
MRDPIFKSPRWRKYFRVQPNVKKIYLLVRTSDTNSAAQRLCDERRGSRNIGEGSARIKKTK